MPLGDSLTTGYYGTEPLPPVQGGYRNRLLERLVDAGYNADFVGTMSDYSDNPDLLDPDHEGHGGIRIAELDAGIEAWFEELRRREVTFGTLWEPDVILLLIGANDFYPRDPDPTDVYLQDAQRRLRSLVDHIIAEQPYATILVANLPARTDFYSDGTPVDDKVQLFFNPQIIGMVEDLQMLGHEVYAVDFHQYSLDMADDVHPSPAGYDQMADIWFEGIADLIGPADTSTRILDVESVNPGSGVTVGVSPVDNSGLGGGVAAFTRLYPNGTAVTLAAPAAVGGNTFQLWERNGVYYSTNATTTITLNASCTMTAVYAPVLAPVNVPEAASFTLVYSLDLPGTAAYNATGVPYEVDKSAAIGAFNRVAYYLELQESGGPLDYVWVSMNPFTADAKKIGVPSLGTGAFFEQNVASMNVRSSVPGVVTRDGWPGGNIEFYCGDYSATNVLAVPAATDALFDWGDTGGTTPSGYGAMQVHNHADSQTIFAFNGWGGVPGFDVDLGIGNSGPENPDWTYAQNGPDYSHKKLQVYVRNGTPPANRTLTINSFNPGSGVTVTVSPADNSGNGTGTTSFTRTYPSGAVVSLTAPATAGANMFRTWRRNGVDYGGGAATVSVTIDANITMTAVYSSTVTGAYVFYNNSAWDGNNPAPNTGDDNAIATDKAPLLPGAKATFANYTSYSRGLNGVMVDVTSLPGSPTASDFRFTVGNDNTPDTWATAPAPGSITVRPVNGSARISLVWGDNAVKKQWLAVVVLATPNTGLDADYTFFYGNAIGETGTFPDNAKIDAADQLGTRANQRTLLNPAPIDFRFDFNRDRKVDAADQLIARANQTTVFNALRLIDLSGYTPDSLRASFDRAATLNAGASHAGTVVSDIPIPVPSQGRLEMRLDADGRLVLQYGGDGNRMHRLQSAEHRRVGGWTDVELSATGDGDGSPRWTVPFLKAARSDITELFHF